MLAQVSSRFLFALWYIAFSLVGFALADEPQYAIATIDGRLMRVRDDRQPALYTADYGDCLGESAINVTRFDAAYYKDNMTIIFHLAGDTALTNEAIMLYIGVYAYGESRFELTFNPCDANIESACPVKAGTPIEAAGIIPINQNDVAGILEIALSIPDFEGEAILRLFSNSTQTEIGCFAAQITNGNTFQQKAAISTVLGIFTLIAALSSFASAIYGDDVTIIRKHYAHSLSVHVVFAVWHHIFYSGSLSMNWPKVLVAFWSNYAWAGGMIYLENMQNTINDFIGANKGNTSHVGAVGTGVHNPTLGGGYDIHQIYSRGIPLETLTIQKTIAKRHLIDATSGFRYYGQPVKPGLPLPGNYSGFAGTLAHVHIPASNAFMTGLLWILILLACVAIFIVLFRVILGGLSKARLVRKDHLAFFKARYLGYTALALLRTLFISFFMMGFLTMFQFSYLDSSGPVAVACVVFIGMVLGLGILGGVACYYRVTFGKYVSEPDRLNMEKRKVLHFLPWFAISRESKQPRSEDKAYAVSLPWWTFRPHTGAKSIHSDEGFIKYFGWFASRYRRTRWWFFIVWIAYDFVRACLLAGASSQPIVQVFGLLIVEFTAFIGMILLRPFEGQRLNIIVVYLLGFSKCSTVALSAAFGTRFNLPRIHATVIGIIIIVIQGLLTIVVMIAIIAGAITSYISLMRNRQEIRPARWNLLRDKYFQSMDFRAQDIPRPPPSPVESAFTIHNSPYFNVKQVKRMAKVEDEDIEFMMEIHNDPSMSQLSVCGQDRPGLVDPQRGGAASIRSQMSHSSLPKRARLHRASWSLQSYGNVQPSGRLKTTDNTMTIPARSSPPSNQSLPQLDAQFGSLISASRSNISTMPLMPHSSEDSDPVNPGSGTGTMSRLTSRSQSNSRPKLEARISEEISALPEKNCTRRMETAVETK
ncbi:Nn.00g095320.m01.CDS01 [Neocucurbitaria sp. VM-36]